jgi:hypothetical protein
MSETKEHVLDVLLQIAEGYGKLTAQELGLIKREKKASDRFAKCLQCPAFKGGMCELCNCVMKAKVLVTNANCPKSKW